MGNEQTSPCSVCNKNRVKVSSGIVLCSYPAQYPWDWFCGQCNTRERGGVDITMTIEDLNRKQWEEANK